MTARPPFSSSSYKRAQTKDKEQAARRMAKRPDPKNTARANTPKTKSGAARLKAAPRTRRNTHTHTERQAAGWAAQRRATSPKNNVQHARAHTKKSRWLSGCRRRPPIAQRPWKKREAFFELNIIPVWRHT